MTTSRVTGILSALVLALAAGCGGSDSSSTPSSAAALCQAAVQAEVARYRSCTGFEVSLANAQSSFDCVAVAEAEAAGRIRYVPEKAQACLDAIPGLSCNLLQVANAEAVAAILDGCRAAIAPQVEVGDPCYSPAGFECVSGSCPFDTEGVCLDGAACVATAGEAESCATKGCGPGLTCRPADTTCVPTPAIQVVAVGQECDAGQSVFCADGLYCSGGTGAGTCVARKGPTVACERKVECLSEEYCDGTCTAYARQGEDCTEVRCGAGLLCKAGVCAPYPKLGEECTPRNLLLGARSTAVSTDECAEGWCDATQEPKPICVPFLAPGTSCPRFDSDLFDVECGPGYACYYTGDKSYGVCGRYLCGGMSE